MTPSFSCKICSIFLSKNFVKLKGNKIVELKTYGKTEESKISPFCPHSFSRVFLIDENKTPSFNWHSILFPIELANSTPSFEQMKNLLLRKKVRPLFPEVWKDSNPAIQQLKETITDSWDDDGEARLNIETIVQRIIELDPMWIKYRCNSDLDSGSGSNGNNWLNNSIQSNR